MNCPDCGSDVLQIINCVQKVHGHVAMQQYQTNLLQIGFAPMYRLYQYI